MSKVLVATEEREPAYVGMGVMQTSVGEGTSIIELVYNINQFRLV